MAVWRSLYSVAVEHYRAYMLKGYTSRPESGPEFLEVVSGSYKGLYKYPRALYTNSGQSFIYNQTLVYLTENCEGLNNNERR